MNNQLSNIENKLNEALAEVEAIRSNNYEETIFSKVLSGSITEQQARQMIKRAKELKIDK